MPTRLRNPLEWIYVRTIWHPEAIPAEEFKYRHLKRVWLPVFDLVSILIGYLGVLYGSRLLNEMFPHEVVDFAAGSFMSASAVALVSVVIPALWPAEIASKLVMLSLLGTYSALIWTSFFNGEVFSGFVAAILMLPVIMPLFRLQILGEEIKQRRVEK